jgi:hypothetical protein
MSNQTQANGPAVDAPERSVGLIDRLLKLPEEVRLDLARLLTDSVREGFTSLAEAEQRDKDLIRSRLDQLVKGEAKPIDPEEMFEEMKRRVAEVRRS